MKQAKIASSVDLPHGWVERLTEGGRLYYVDHKTQTTTWDDPRLASLEDAPAPYGS